MVRAFRRERYPVGLSKPAPRCRPLRLFLRQKVRGLGPRSLPAQIRPSSGFARLGPGRRPALPQPRLCVPALRRMSHFAPEARSILNGLFFVVITTKKRPWREGRDRGAGRHGRFRGVAAGRDLRVSVADITGLSLLWAGCPALLAHASAFRPQLFTWPDYWSSASRYWVPGASNEDWNGAADLRAVFNFPAKFALVRVTSA